MQNVHSKGKYMTQTNKIPTTAEIAAQCSTSRIVAFEWGTFLRRTVSR